MQKVDKFTLATVMQAGIAIPAVVLIAIYPPQFEIFSRNTYLLLILAIIFTIGLQLTNVKALQYLEAGTYAVLYNLRIIFATALGILFLSEDFIWARIAGGGLIFAAILILRQKGSRSSNIRGFFWGVIAALILSFLNLFEKSLINDIGFINYLPLTAIVSFVLMWAYHVYSKRGFSAKIFTQPNMLKLMSLRALSAYGFSGALGAGALISVSNYVSGMSVIFTVLLGAWLLKERDYLKRKLIASTVAIIGLTLVALASLV